MWLRWMLTLLLFGLRGVCADCWHFLVVIGCWVDGNMPTAWSGDQACVPEGSSEGVLFPLVLKNSSASVDFAWSMRIIGLITLVCWVLFV